MSYKPLQFLFRPKKFSEVVGQNILCTSLSNIIITKKIHFSYMFSGPKGIGKTTLARIFAKSLNCLNIKNGEPCLTCLCCTSFKKDNFMDFIEIDAAINSNLDEIKKLLDTMYYKPLFGKYKVFLIDEIHMLSRYSFSYLLKLLEEPPFYVKFILVTTEYEKIPETILSRCVHYFMNPLSVIDIKVRLISILNESNIIYNNEIIHLIAFKSKGSMRDALNIVENIFSISGKLISLNIVNKIFGLISIYDIIFLLRVINKKHKLFLYWYIKKIFKFNLNYFNIVNDFINLINALIFYKQIKYVSNFIYNEFFLKNNINFFSINFLYLIRKIFIFGKKNFKYFNNSQDWFLMLILLLF